MSLPTQLKEKLVLPAFCAPMYKVSTPELVKAACLAGIAAGLPRHNAQSPQQFELWLKDIALARAKAIDKDNKVGLLAVNITTSRNPEQLERDLMLCKQYGVDIIVNATGDPTELTERAHDHGLLLFADVINMRYAEKAISAGVDGIIAIGCGGGGHSGSLSHLALIPAIRKIYKGVVVMAGCISNGASIRAAEILGADLAYLGTRFIATRESSASEEYKSYIVEGSAHDLLYTHRITGIPANWLKASLAARDLDPDQLTEPPTGSGKGITHLPASARPWTNIWSAGQGIELINDIPSVENLIERLKKEYSNAVEIKPFNHI